MARLPPPPDPPSGFLDLLTVFAAPGPRGLVSCRLRSWDSPFRAFPFQESVPLTGPLLPCGWVSTFCSGHRSPGPVSHGHLRSRQGGSPSRGASSFSVSLTTAPKVEPSASLAPHPRPPHPPPRSPFRAHGWEPNGRSMEPGGQSELLAGVWSASAPKLCSSWKSVRVAFRLPCLTTADALLGFAPLELSPDPRWTWFPLPAVARHRDRPLSHFCGRAGPSSSRALSRPRGEPSER